MECRDWRVPEKGGTRRLSALVVAPSKLCDKKEEGGDDGYLRHDESAILSTLSVRGADKTDGGAAKQTGREGGRGGGGRRGRRGGREGQVARLFFFCSAAE